MNERIDQVRKHYDEDPRQEWDRLENHPFEFILTTHMMEKYIRPGDAIRAPNYREILSRDKDEIDQWIEVAKRYLELPELLAYSEHAMYIGRKLP